MGFEKLKHSLPHQLIADAATAQVEGVLGIGHADQPGFDPGGLGPFGSKA